MITRYAGRCDVERTALRAATAYIPIFAQRRALIATGAAG